MLDLFFLVVFFLLLIVFVIVGVAFLTLLECKVLGYVHIRKGPNRVGFVGILQPFRDAINCFLGSSIFLLFLIT
jgi:NADH-ubiquinone oxidoreductase chain 1